MRVRYTIPGWQPTMPRGVAAVRPPAAFREMIRSRQGIPDTDWKEPLRARPRATLKPALEPPSFPRGLELHSAETGRAGMRNMFDRLPSTGGPALEQLRDLLREQAAFESRVLIRAAAGSPRG